MAVSDVKTLLPLDTWAKILSVHPLFFNQVMVNDLNPGGLVVGGFSDNPANIILQRAWQGSDKIGRDDIAQAIADAEDQIFQELHFSTAPTWQQSEYVALPKPANPNLVAAWGIDGRGQWQSVRLGHGYVIQGGLETKTLVQAGATVTYTDTDGDGYHETATIVTTSPVPTGTTAGEVAIYYPGRGGTVGYEDGFEVRPTKVSINGTTGFATIVARREQFVHWDLLDQFNPVAVDGLDNTSFLATVDVYRHWTDISQQVTFLWEKGSLGWPFGIPGFAWTCGQCGSSTPNTCPGCQLDTQTGCTQLRKPRLGEIYAQPAVWDATAGAFQAQMWADCRYPDAGLFNYKHGIMRPVVPNGASADQEPDWQKAVCYLSLTKLRRELQAYDQLENWSKYWSEDKTLIVAGQNAADGRYQVSARTTDNPLGGTRAAEFVWRKVQKTRVNEPVKNL